MRAGAARSVVSGMREHGSERINGRTEERGLIVTHARGRGRGGVMGWDGFDENGRNGDGRDYDGDGIDGTIAAEMGSSLDGNGSKGDRDKCNGDSHELQQRQRDHCGGETPQGHSISRKAQQLWPRGRDGSRDIFGTSLGQRDSSKRLLDSTMASGQEVGPTTR